MFRKLKHILSESSFFIFSFYFSRGLRMAFIMITPLIMGFIFDGINLGILVSSGALIAGIGDSPGNYRIKLNSQFIGSLFYCSVVLITQLLLPPPNHWSIIYGLWIALCGFFFSMFFIYGSRVVNIATSSLLCIIYASSFPNPGSIAYNTIGIAVGIVFYGIVSLGLWRIQPYRVIEQKISENIKFLSEYLDLLNQYFLVRIEKTRKKNKEKNILQKLFEKQQKIHDNHEDLREYLFKLRINARSFSTYGRRMVLTFNSLIDLYEQFISINLQDDKLIAVLKKYELNTIFSLSLNNMQKILNEINWAINLHKKITININTSLIDILENKIQDIRQSKNNQNLHEIEIDINILKHLKFIFKTFYKQTNTIKSITNGSFNSSSEDLDMEKFTQSYNYSLNTFRINLNLRSNIYRHALRVSVAIILAYIISILLEINYFSWILLTIILILKPVYGNTRTYSIKRLIGTLIGGTITFSFLFFIHDPLYLFILMVISVIGAYSFIALNYKVGVAFVTIFVLLLIYLEGKGDLVNIYNRIIGTSIAVIIAFFLSFIFLPFWEYKLLPMLVRKLIKYNLNYFEKVTHNYLKNDKISISELKLARKDLLLGTTNLSSAFQRVISERKISPSYLANVYSIQTLNNLLSTRISSLKTYLIEEKLNPNDLLLIEYIKDNFNNCLLIIDFQNIPSDKTLEIEMSFIGNDNSLLNYQLKEINYLIQDIYKHLLKARRFSEWKNSPILEN